MSRYHSFRQLSSDKVVGADFGISRLDRGTQLVVIAPHGGGIEPGTAEIARALAGEIHSCYIFDGLRDQDNHELHLTSTVFDEPQCLEMLREAHTVLAVHGCAGEEEIVYVGGLCESFKQCLIQAMNGAGFAAQMDDSGHAGSSPRNICNMGSRGMGAQLEVPRGLRRKMFQGLSRKGRKEMTPTFDAFIAAVRAAMEAHQRLHCRPGISR